MTMVEKAARAIATSLEVSPESWRDHADEARAVIQAMREISAEVAQAAFDVELKDPNGFVATMTGADDFQRWFARMVDAALAEGS